MRILERPRAALGEQLEFEPGSEWELLGNSTVLEKARGFISEGITFKINDICLAIGVRNSGGRRIYEFVTECHLQKGDSLTVTLEMIT